MQFEKVHPACLRYSAIALVTRGLGSVQTSYIKLDVYSILRKLRTAGEAAHEKRNKDTHNFLVTVVA
jgi:hypothetical protein